MAMNKEEKKANADHFIFPILLFFFFFFLSFSSLSSSSHLPPPNDTVALTNFRLLTDTHGNLLSNWTGPDACSATWHGVHCTSTGRVSGLSLPSLNLRGPILSLSPLDQLRLVDLHDNRLNGTISPLTNCTNLVLIYLAGNDLSGEIPLEISSLKTLTRLDLSDNNIHGSIPDQLSHLTLLITLRLQNNLLSGKIPDFSASLTNLKEVNLTNNELNGKLPDGLLTKFGYKSFSGNEGLCGSGAGAGPSRLQVCTASPSSINNSDEKTFPLKPNSFPQKPLLSQTDRQNHRGLKSGVIVAIVIATSVALLVTISFFVAYCCAKDRNNSNSNHGSEVGKKRSYGSSTNGSEKKVYSNGDGDSDGTNVTDRSKLVFFDRKKGFELEDLLRASAEMVGKGSLGTVYRAVLDDGCTVAVKRLKDANPCGRKEFEEYMEIIGRVRDKHIARLRAYYYAKEEKLLVYDFLSNGSLHSLLHGNRGPGRVPLDWTTRISLVLGAARGLSRIHEEYSESKIPHGNVKSSNVLLDKNGVACISDFGLSLLLSPAHAIARLGGYKAPEQSETKKLSQEADVYSFGILLLEVLTGRFPSLRAGGDDPALDLPKWVRSVVKEEWTAEVFDQELLRYKNIEEELVSMLHLGLACVAEQPEKRPTMPEVTKMITEIRVEQSPLGEEQDESRNSLSPSIPTTDDGLV